VRGLKVVSVFAVKAHERGGLAPPLLNFGGAWSPHAPAALPPRKAFPLPTTVWAFWTRDKCVDLAGNRTPDFPARSPDRYAILTPPPTEGTASCETSASLVMKFPYSLLHRGRF